MFIFKISQDTICFPAKTDLIAPMVLLHQNKKLLQTK